jgi:peptidyl-prolyl cis-trans isomerase C
MDPRRGPALAHAGAWQRSKAWASLALALIACAPSSCNAHKSAPAAAGDAGAAAAVGITPEQAAQELARVGDRTITVGDFVAALEHMDQFDRMRYQAPERRQELLAEMVDVMLLADVAHEKGYDQDPIAQQEVREILRDAMLKSVRGEVPAPGDIPEVDVRSYYDAHRADFRDPERRRVSAIVVADDAAGAAVLEAAKKASATQWGELVRAKSLDARAKEGSPSDLAGDFGFVAPPDDRGGSNPRIPEEVRAAVFEISAVEGVLPRVVKSGGRGYVVKLTAKTEAHDRTFAEAERAIRVRLAQDRIKARQDELLEELRKKYPVEIDEHVLSEVHVDTSGDDAGLR